MSTGRSVEATTRFRLATLVGLMIVALAGCILQLPSPYIRLETKEGYNESQILVPYEIYGESGFAQARWSLDKFDVSETEWDSLESREVRIPSGSSGVLELGNLDEGRYRVEISLLTTRSGTYERVPYLTETREFFVDRNAPYTPQDGDDYDYYDPTTGALAGNSGTVLPLLGEDWDVDYSNVADWNVNVEAPVTLLVSVGGATILRPEDHDQNGLQFFVGDMGANVYWIQAVDAAGNRGSVEVLNFP